VHRAIKLPNGLLRLWPYSISFIVEKANVRSKRFTDTLINEARDLKIIKSMVSRDGYKRYGLVYEKELFDETF
jgi:hypothetical protein